VDVQILVGLDQRSVEVAVLDCIGSAAKEVADTTILTLGTPHGLGNCGPFWGVKGLAAGRKDLAFLFAWVLGVCDVGGWITSTRGEFFISASFFVADQTVYLFL